MNKKTGTVRYIIPVIACMVLVALDQLTKKLAVARLMDGPVDLIKGVFQLRYLENRGAAFGLLQGQRVLFFIIAILVMVIVVYVYTRIPEGKRYNLLRMVLVLLLAGAVGNTIDRMMLNYVIDFLYFELINFPIFNVADCYVTVSAAALIFLLMFYYKEEELSFLSRKKKAEEA